MQKRSWRSLFRTVDMNYSQSHAFPTHGTLKSVLKMKPFHFAVPLLQPAAYMDKCIESLLTRATRGKKRVYIEILSLTTVLRRQYGKEIADAWQENRSWHHSPSDP